MIYRAHIKPQTYLLMVLRAPTVEIAMVLATVAAKEYYPGNVVDRLEEYDPYGPAEVLCEDAS